GNYREPDEIRVERLARNKKQTVARRGSFSELEPAQPGKEGRSGFAVGRQHGFAGHIRNGHVSTPLKCVIRWGTLLNLYRQQAAPARPGETDAFRSLPFFLF